MVEVVFADFVEEFDEVVVLLAVDVFEFEGLEVDVLEDFGREEIWAVVDFFKERGFVAGNYRRELVEVTDEGHFHAAEWLARIEVEAEAGVDAVHQVGANH